MIFFKEDNKERKGGLMHCNFRAFVLRGWADLCCSVVCYVFAFRVLEKKGTKGLSRHNSILDKPVSSELELLHH